MRAPEGRRSSRLWSKFSDGCQFQGDESFKPLAYGAQNATRSSLSVPPSKPTKANSHG
jgi:hypothetical protein